MSLSAASCIAPAPGLRIEINIGDAESRERQLLLVAQNVDCESCCPAIKFILIYLFAAGFPKPLQCTRHRPQSGLKHTLGCLFGKVQLAWQMRFRQFRSEGLQL